MSHLPDSAIPEQIRPVLRGVGQVFFQENAITGICFILGVALSSPLMALGLALGAVIGTATARLLKFDPSEYAAGIYGFNAALVGIGTLFFFKPSLVAVLLLVAGCVVATLLTRVVRRYVPFPTYTGPFVATTWAIFLIGTALDLARTELGGGPPEGGYFQAIAHGVSQVMFQASIWTTAFFLAGIALSDWRHAAWVLAGSIVGMLMGNYHLTASARALDPESLVDRAQFEIVTLGLYGYNATLSAVALYLWSRSLIPPLLGMLLSVPITELVPMVGVPALTAPFVLSTWIVLGLGRLDAVLFGRPTPPVA